MAGADLSFSLTQREEQKLTHIYPIGNPTDKFSLLLKRLGLDVESVYDSQTRTLSIKGPEATLKIADYIFLSWIHEFNQAELKFTHHVGSLAQKDIKGQFTRKLLINDNNKFQFSNKLIEGEKQDINGFSFDVTPLKSVFESAIDFKLGLSYKNNKTDKGGSQFLDLNTNISIDPGKDYVLQLTDEHELGWGSDSFLVIQLNHGLGSTRFKNKIPRSMPCGQGQLRILPVSEELKESLQKDPMSFFEKLGLSFPDWSFIHLNKMQNEVLMYSSKENFDLLEQVASIKQAPLPENVFSQISIYESNLIIKDTDKLEGHTLKKLTSFSTICTKAENFLLSKRFDGQYESSTYTNIRMPQMNNSFSYDILLKLPGPKSKAKSFKIKGNFGRNKKYRLHLDDYHFMEVQIIK